jgi:D-glycero-alpha-D-manno-heptose-7-phosphate kinase
LSFLHGERWATRELGARAFITSATRGSGIPPLREALEDALPVSPFLYDPEDIASQPVRFFVAELIREALRVVGVDSGIEITSISDIPSQGTGLGSSSTYTVGLLTALYAYMGQHVGAERLAREACRIEIDVCGKPIGKQDQYIAAYGGLQHIRFNPDESVFVDPVICSPNTKRALQESLLLLYTGVTRSADDILLEQTRNTHDDVGKRDVLRAMVAQTEDLRAALVANDLGGVGEVLHQGWLAKKKLASGITSPRL